MERSSLDLSIMGFPFRPFPPLPSFLPSSLLSPEARTRHLHGQGWQPLGSTAGTGLPSLPRPAAAGPGGRRVPALPRPPPAPRYCSVWGSRAVLPAGGGEANRTWSLLRALVPDEVGSTAGSARVALSKPPRGRAGRGGRSGGFRQGRVYASRPVLGTPARRDAAGAAPPAWQPLAFAPRRRPRG